MPSAFLEISLAACLMSFSVPWFKGKRIVLEFWYSRSLVSMPHAENNAGTGGIMTSGMSSSIAIMGANIGPPPPKPTRLNSRGSSPRSTVISLTAATFLETMIRKMLDAASSTDIFRGWQIVSFMAFSAKDWLIRISPFKNHSGRKYPRTSAASVTVGFSPPRS